MQLQGYSKIELVGEGGLGRVYRAVKVSTGGTVAIKELRDVSAASPAWHRARRELDALLRLKGHAHVISVEEVIDGPDGPCLVMEYAASGSLFDRVQRGPLSTPELVLVGQHVCDALTASHAADVLHRDIKPHNLLIDVFGQVKVCDFGIASLARDGELRTKTGALTTTYASPEELDGSDDIGPATDVYSLALTMLHLASGRRPSFRDRVDAITADFALEGDSLSASIALLRQALAHGPSDRPSVTQLSASFDEDSYRLGPLRIKALDRGHPPTIAAQTGHASKPVVSDGTSPTRARPTQRRSEATLTIKDAPASTIPRTSHAVEPSSVPPKGRSPIVIGAVVAAIALGAAVAIVMTPWEKASLPVDTTQETTGVDAPISQASTTPNTATTATTASATIGPAIPPGAVLITMSQHADRVRSAEFSPDGTRVVSASKDGTAIVWAAETGAVITTYRGHTDQLFSAAFSPDGTRVVSAGADDTARIWDAATGTTLKTLSGHTADVNSAMFSPDGTRIVTASDDGTIQIWDAVSGFSLTTLVAAAPFASAQFSPDGIFIVTASLDDTAIVFDLTSGETTNLVGHADDVYSAAFSPDGSRVVTASKDGTAIIWDSETGSQLTTLKGHTDRVFSARFSPDGSRVVTASWDKTAIVWDTATGNQLLRLIGHTAQLFSASFSPDGSHVVTASDDDTARIWYVGST